MFFTSSELRTPSYDLESRIQNLELSFRLLYTGTMKILHFADLHLGMENYGKLDPATGLNSRLGDFLKSFDYLIETALQEKVDLVIFAGDAFKTREPNPTYQRAFAERIKVLSDAKIPTLLLVGNHDLPNVASKADTLAIYDTLNIPLVHVGNKAEILKIETGHGPCQVITLPWITKSHFLASNQELHKASDAEVGSQLLEKLLQVLGNLIDQLDPKIPSVLACHATIQGATFGAERNVMLGHDLVLPLGSVSDPRLNYVALGHLHKHQVLNENPPVIYSGSIERVDFGEEKEVKGFILADLNVGQQTHFEFRPTPARAFLSIEVSLSENELDPTAKIVTAIKAHDVKDKIVKLKLSLPRALNELINTRVLLEALAGANYFAGLQKDFTDAARVKSLAEQASTETDPIEALHKYLRTRQVGEDRSKELETKAQELLQEVLAQND